ncbi:MAG: TPM domain-containing protein [Deltaproteobacteria bacterium]|nr:TPM domain-containing protein [Deltaproteobacteria bacterium]
MLQIQPEWERITPFVIILVITLFTANPALSYVPDDLDFAPMGDGAVSEAPSQAVSIPENPGNHVVDLAGIIDNSIEVKLNQYLKELEQKTTSQVAILTIKSLEGELIEDLSITVAHDRWKLGQKGKDNGVLLLVSIMDRKYRIEVGYGLEGVIPDSLAGSIGRSYLVPFFKKGDYSNGIFAATTVMANLIAEDSGVKISGMPELKRSVQRTGKD